MEIMFINYSMVFVEMQGFFYFFVFFLYFWVFWGVFR
jgi:hypothetical protein